MPNSAERTEIRKDQIKAAAIRCVSQYGYNKTTMDDIANAIGMKKASLYYYYKNKEAIIHETIEAEVYNFINSAKEKLSKVKTATKKLYMLVKLETEYFQERVGTFDLSVSTIIETQPVLNEMLNKFRAKYIDLWASIIREGIENEEFRKCNTYKVADTIRTVLDSIKFRELQLTKLFSANEIDYKKIKKSGKDMIDLIIHGLKKC